MLGARRASRPQARHLHRPTSRGAAAHPRPHLVVLSRPQGLPGRAHAAAQGCATRPLQPHLQAVAPASPPSTACSNAFTPTSPSCSSSWIVRRSLYTPTDPRTTSVAKSSGARSVAALAATSAATAATPFSGSPKPAASSASPFGTSSAPGSVSWTVPPFRTFQTSSAAAASPPNAACARGYAPVTSLGVKPLKSLLSD